MAHILIRCIKCESVDSFFFDNGVITCGECSTVPKLPEESMYDIIDIIPTEHEP